MRPDAATVGRVTDHQVVQPRVGHKTKALQQVVDFLHMQVHALHQQGPARALERRQRTPGKRPMAQLPAGGASSLADHQARFNLLLRREREQRGGIERRHITSEGLADQQRLFLPVALHEQLGAQATQKLQALVHIHGSFRSKAPQEARSKSAPCTAWTCSVLPHEAATILLWKLHNNAWSR